MPEEPKERFSGITADITVAVLVFLVALAIFGIYLDRLLDWYRGIIEWFYGKDWEGINRTLAVVFTFINVGLIGFSIWAFRRYRSVKKRVVGREVVVHPVRPKDEVRENWERVRTLANSANPSDWNMAVLHADALLDDVLAHLGYEGTTVAERLKIVDPTKLPSMERIWSAHRLRNMIAHDPMAEHTRETVIAALRSYEQALKELGMRE